MSEQNCNYTIEELDWAIDHLLPTVAKAKDQGVKFSRPDLLKQVAWNEMVLEYSENREDFQSKYPKYPQARYIVGLAASDLHKYGYFKFRGE